MASRVIAAASVIEEPFLRVVARRRESRERIGLQEKRFASLLAEAAHLRDEGHGNAISYSRKVFVPLTKLCRDVCHYCTFAEPPKSGRAPFLAIDEVLAIAREGQRHAKTIAVVVVSDVLAPVKQRWGHLIRICFAIVV